MGLGTTEVEGRWDLGENFWDEFWGSENDAYSDALKEEPRRAVVISLGSLINDVEEIAFRLNPALSGVTISNMIILAALIHIYRLGSPFDEWRRVLRFITDTGVPIDVASRFMSGITDTLDDYLRGYLEYPPVKMYYRLLFLDSEDIVYVPITRDT